MTYAHLIQNPDYGAWLRKPKTAPAKDAHEMWARDQIERSLSEEINAR